jgi:hypothetical protein
LRRPRITSNAPEINAIALPAEAGLTSGTATVAKAALPIPINSNVVPSSFTMDLLWTLGNWPVHLSHQHKAFTVGFGRPKIEHDSSSTAANAA